MANTKYTPRVAETATVSGTTQAFQLQGASGINRPFSGVYTNGTLVMYAATGFSAPTATGESTEWEIGTGTFFTGTPSTVSRDSVLYSSNSDSAVDFTAPNVVVQNISSTAFASGGGPTAILSNPSVTIPTQPDGSGGDYTGAGGTFYVFDGSTDITTSNPSAIAYSVSSYTSGLTISINASGVYTASLDTAHNSGQAILLAVYNSIPLRQTYTIQKNLTGQALKLTADAAGFTYQNNSPYPANQTVTLTATPENLSGSITWGPSGVAALLTITGDTATLTAANFDTLNQDQVEITVTDGVISDSIFLVKLTPTATTNITGDLTNPTVTIPTDSSGTGGDFSGASGVFLMWDSGTDITGNGPTYSVASADSALTISINSTSGDYSVTALSANSAKAVLQATYNGVVVQRSFTIQKNLRGQDLVLSASGYSFDFANEQLVSGQSDITISATLTNLTGTPTWTTSPSGVTLTGTGNSRTLTGTNFAAANSKEVTVTATLNGVSDSVTIVKLTTKASTPENNSGTLYNPGFEAGNTGWTLNGWTIVDDAANAQSGSWYATITNSSNYIVNNQTVPTSFADQIRVRANFKSSSTATGTGYVGITYYDGSGAVLSRTFTDATHLGQSVGGPQTTYTTAVMHAVAPQLARSASLTAYVSNCAGQWYLDNCFMDKLPVNMGQVPDDPVGKRGGINTDYIDTVNRPTVLRRATGAIDVTADNLSQHSEVTDHIGGLGVPTVSLDTKVTDGTSRFAWKASQQTALITNKGGENHVIDPNLTSTDFWPVSNTVNLGGDGTIRSGPLTSGAVVRVDNLDGRGNKAITKCEPGDLVGSLFKITGAGGQGVNWNIIFVDSTGADISPSYNAGVQTAVGTYEMTPVAAPANAVGVRGQWAFHDETGGTGGVAAGSPTILIGSQTVPLPGGQKADDVNVGGGRAVAETGADVTSVHLCNAGTKCQEGVCYDGVAVDISSLGLASGVTPVIFLGGGGVTYDTTLTGTQAQSFGYTNVSNTSFTPSLKITELTGSTTPQTDNFSPYNTATSSATATLSATAYDGNYTANFSVYQPGLTTSAYNSTVAIVDNLGTAVYSKVLSLLGQSTQSFSPTFKDTAVSSGGSFTLSISGDATLTPTVTATTLTYSSGTAPTANSATPAGAPGVYYVAYPPS